MTTDEKKVIYHSVDKDVDSNQWWWATCNSKNEADNLVILLNGYEETIQELRAEIAKLKDGEEICSL
jgi:hypothetical protein